jgi:hypothetical protein
MDNLEKKKQKTLAAIQEHANRRGTQFATDIAKGVSTVPFEKSEVAHTYAKKY